MSYIVLRWLNIRKITAHWLIFCVNKKIELDHISGIKIADEGKIWFFMTSRIKNLNEDQKWESVERK